MKGIIVLEGADCSGKTTLARHFIDSHDAEYLHCGISDDVWQLHLDTLQEAIFMSQKKLVVIDRLWLSECAYGVAYRGGAAYPVAARCLDRLLLKHAAVTVLCVPGDLKYQIETHKQMKAERHEEFGDIRPVVQWYKDLATGNVAQGGNDYGSQYCRYGDYTERQDVILYDYLSHGTDVPRYCKAVLTRLKSWRSAQWAPLLTEEFPFVVGHAATATALFVGEAAVPEAEGPQWPGIWKEKASSAHFFNSRLHSLGFRETKGLWVNALDGHGSLYNVLEYLYESGKAINIKLVVLGSAAAKEIEKLAVARPAWVFRDSCRIRHPQTVKAFGYNEDKYKREIVGALR